MRRGHRKAVCSRWQRRSAAESGRSPGGSWAAWGGQVPTVMGGSCPTARAQVRGQPLRDSRCPGGALAAPGQSLNPLVPTIPEPCRRNDATVPQSCRAQREVTGTRKHWGSDGQVLLVGSLGASCSPVWQAELPQDSRDLDPLPCSSRAGGLCVRCTTLPRLIPRLGDLGERCPPGVAVRV